MTYYPTPIVQFVCADCGHKEEIELDIADKPTYGKILWCMPSIYECEWFLNEDNQLMCQSCDHENAELAMRGELLSKKEKK